MLDAILFFGFVFVVFVWVPILGYALVRRMKGREPFPYDPSYDDDEAVDPPRVSQQNRLPAPLVGILAMPVVVLGLAAILFMFVIFGPPTMLADWIWRLHAKDGAGRPPKGANEP